MSLPKPVPYRMKPKKKVFSLKGRRNIAYLLALLTLGYMVFSTLGGGKEEAKDYQLASPNEFVGIQKGKMTDYDKLAEEYEDEEGKAADFAEVMAEGEAKSKKVYNIKEPKKGKKTEKSEGKRGKGKEKVMKGSVDEEDDHDDHEDM